jgi:hypothetical protein
MLLGSHVACCNRQRGSSRCASIARADVHKTAGAPIWGTLLRYHEVSAHVRCRTDRHQLLMQIYRHSRRYDFAVGDN